MDGRSPVTCAICGDRIGVYEPAVVMGADGVRKTSRAYESQPPSEDAILVHESCYAAAGEPVVP